MVAILNGRLPASMLLAIPWAPTKRLTAAAVTDLVALDAAFHARFGHHLIVNEGYRDYATQVDYKTRTKLPRSDPRWLGSAATPGTSVHGMGEAADFGQLGGFHSDEYAWLLEHAPAFGWHHPAQYDEGTKHPEPWHWEHDPNHKTKTTPTPEPRRRDVLIIKDIRSDAHYEATDLAVRHIGDPERLDSLKLAYGPVVEMDAADITRLQWQADDRRNAVVAQIAKAVPAGGGDPKAVADEIARRLTA